MKKNYLILCLAAFFAFFAVIAEAASIPTVSLSLLNTYINAGDKFYIDVKANGDGSSEALLMFGFDVKTTGSYFSYDGYTLGSGFFPASDPNDPNNVSGMMGTGTAGNDVLLARLSFTALDAGTGGSVQVIGCNIKDLYTDPNSSAAPYDPNAIVDDPNHPGQKFYGLMYQSSEYVINSNAKVNIAVGTHSVNLNITQIAAGGSQTLGLKADGTVIAAGIGPDVSSWKSITQIAAGGSQAIGLKKDGTVVVEGGYYDLSNWTGITQVAAGTRHIVGLKSDGTVVAAGDDSQGECSLVASWTGIKQVAAGGDMTIGLTNNGTVLCVSDGMYGKGNVWGWSGIIQVSAGAGHIVGLQSDGTVVAVGDNSMGQCGVSGWTGIDKIAAGPYHTVGIKEGDGSVVVVGAGNQDVSTWTDIIQVAAGGGAFTIGLQNSGTIVAAGDCRYNQCQLDGGDTPVVVVEPGDINHDGSIDFNDISVLMSAIRTCSGDVEFISEGDFDEDGCITPHDIQEWYDYYSSAE